MESRTRIYCRRNTRKWQKRSDTRRTPSTRASQTQLPGRKREGTRCERSSSLVLGSTRATCPPADAILARIKDNKPTLITGDFNVCTVKQPTNSITKKLLDLGFSQLVTKATHIRGGHIDHVYWRDSIKPAFRAPVVERYSPYYSDHDCLLVTLPIH